MIGSKLLTLSCLTRREENGEQHLHFKITQWKEKGILDILNDISENITSIQFMNKFGNVNHAVIIFGYRIFDSD